MSEEKMRVPPVVAQGAALEYRAKEELQWPEGWRAGEVFRLAPERLWEWMCVLIIFRVINGAVVWSVLMGVVWLWFREDSYEEKWLLTLVNSAIMGLTIFVTVGRALWKARRMWPSYVLMVSDDGVATRGLGLRDVKLEAPAILRIVEAWDGFVLHLGGGTRVSLPKRVAGVERLRARLEKFRAIEMGKGLTGVAGVVGLSFLVTVALMGSVITGMTVPQMWLGLLCLLVASGCTGISIWWVWRIKSARWGARIGALTIVVAPLVLALRLMVRLILGV